VLYTREGCHLCERAKVVLDRLQAEFSLEIQEVDISTDDALLAEYGEIIPVVVIDGRHRFEPNKIAEFHLRKVLSAPARRWPWQRGGRGDGAAPHD
jgi:glutaredoxin